MYGNSGYLSTSSFRADLPQLHCKKNLIPAQAPGVDKPAQTILPTVEVPCESSLRGFTK